MLGQQLQYTKAVATSNKSKQARRRLRSILDKVCAKYGTSVEKSRCPMKNNRKVTYLLRFGTVDYLSCFIREKKDDIILIPNNYTVCFEANSQVWIGRVQYKQRAQESYNTAAFEGEKSPYCAFFEVTPIDDTGEEIPALSSGLQDNISAAFKLSLSKMRELQGQSQRLDKASLRPNGRLYIGVYYSTVQKKLRDHLKEQLLSGGLDSLPPTLKDRLAWWINLEGTEAISSQSSKARAHVIPPKQNDIQPAPTPATASSQFLRTKKTSQQKPAQHPIPQLPSTTSFGVNLSTLPNPLTAVPSFSAPLLDVNLLSNLLTNRTNYSQPSFNIPIPSFNLQQLPSTITSQHSFQMPLMNQGKKRERQSMSPDQDFVRNLKAEILPLIHSVINNHRGRGFLIESVCKALEEIKNDFQSGKRVKIESFPKPSTQQNMIDRTYSTPSMNPYNQPHLQSASQIPRQQEKRAASPTSLELPTPKVEEFDFGSIFDNGNLYNRMSFGNLALSAMFEESPNVVSLNMTPEAFYLTLDVHRNQSVGEKELKQALKCLKIPITSSIVKKTYQACDKNGDGKISLEEFVTYLRQREAELKSLFESMDLNSDGYVTLEELQKARANGQFHASDDELKGLINWMESVQNSNKDGKIDFEEFRTNMVLFPPATTIQEILHLLKKKQKES